MNLPDFVQRNVILDHLNTFALPATAAWFAAIQHPVQLERLVHDLKEQSLPRFILGGGSNVILTGDFDGLVLHVQIPGRALIAEKEDAWIVRAGAGENWHEFVRWTLSQGWPGLENLALIPGTVGAAPVQNIGAYGLEIKDQFEYLEAIDLQTGAMMVFDRAACRFGYRDSFFKREAAGRCLITAVVFRLPKHWQPQMRYADLAQELAARNITHPMASDIFDAVVAIRRRKLPDPVHIGNVGSFFKNPVVSAEEFQRLITCYPDLPHYPQADGTIKLAAGWLIEYCDWKGRDLGPVGVYEQQALVLVNRGGARGADVLRLAQAVQDSVQAMFTVTLEPEPVIL